MYIIGVFATARSLRNILRIDNELRSQCNVTYLPYTSLEHLCYLFEQNADRFDGYLFGGLYPYRTVQHKFGPLHKPHAYFTVSDRDYYQIIARMLVQNPTLDFRRVYFDRPEIPVDFRSVFGREDAPLLGSAPIDWQQVDDWYPSLKEYYLSLWNSGKVDLLVTRFGSLEDYFTQNHIRHEFLFASPESMIETFNGLLTQINTSAVHDSAACLALIASPQPLNAAQWAALGARLEACNKQFGMPFLIYERGQHYELTTNISVLKELSRQYTTCPVTAFLEAGVDFPVCTGWGCANNVIDAHRNAQRAEKEALLTKGSAAFIVTEDNGIIGPLSSVRRIQYTDAPDPQLTRLSEQMGVSALYLSKIFSVLNQKGSDTLSAEELAFYLSITSRSASRILSKLVERGGATVQYNRQLNLRGRPAKIYKITLRRQAAEAALPTPPPEVLP